MKVLLFLCLALVALQDQAVDAQGSWLPSFGNMPSFSDVAKITSAVNSFHSTLSNSPLKPFLPSSTQLLRDILRISSAAATMQESMKKAGDYMNSVIAGAANKANLSLPDLNKLTSQLQGPVTEVVRQVGSAPPAGK